MLAAVFRKQKGQAVGEKDGKPHQQELKEGEGVEGEVVFSFDPADDEERTRLSSNPLLRDPYESERVHVGPSTLAGAGEGLFASCRMLKGEVVAFYNGFRIPHAEVDARDWCDCSNTISLDEDDVIDVPQQFADTRVYAASLAHKANCQIEREKNNSRYDTFEHPRFGFIKCIRLVRDVEEGEEIFVDYDYNTEWPDWYTPRPEGRKEKKGEGEEEEGD